MCGQGGATSSSSSTGGNDGGGGAGGAPVITHQIEAGPRSTCVLIREGETWCWGEHGYGNGSSATPIQVPGAGLDIGMGVGHACRLRPDRRVECWGANSDGQLGNNTQDPSPLEDEVSGLAGVIDIAAGHNNTAAVVGSDVFVWGDNEGQQIPGTATSPVTVPFDISLANATAVSFGREFGCAIRAGDVWCWGRNNLRQADPMNGVQVVLSPVRVDIGTGSAVDLTVSDVFACAAKDDGTVWCWGGVNLAANGAEPPFQVAGIDGVTKVRASPDTLEVGSSHLCALRGTEVWCWGNGLSGQLGLGANANSFTPTVVQVGCAAVDVATGAEHTCALCDDDTVKCWGSNFRNALGTTGGDVNAPQALSPF